MSRAVGVQPDFRPDFNMLCKIAICMLVFFVFSMDTQTTGSMHFICKKSKDRFRGREGGQENFACPAMHDIVSLLHFRTKSVTTCTTSASPVPLMPAGVMSWRARVPRHTAWQMPSVAPHNGAIRAAPGPVPDAAPIMHADQAE